MNQSDRLPPIRRLATRTQPFQESVIREMTRLGDETESVNLSQGLPDFESPPAVLEAAVQAVLKGDNQYTFPFGTPDFRTAIAAKVGRMNHLHADPETEVTVTCGVSEAIVSTILALTEPGDEVVILEPWYENYLPACLLAGATPRFVRLREPNYELDTQALKAAFNEHTRLILINTPHNPTGRVFTQAELEAIAALCQAYGVIAVTDEIYEHIVYDGRQHVSLGSLPGMEDRTVTTSGLGKAYALTGWRVGWAVAYQPLSALIRKVHDYLTICAPAPFQAAGIVALELPDRYYTDMQAEYASRRAILLNALDIAGLTYQAPEGAYYVMADFSGVAWNIGDYAKEGWTTDRAFAEFLARFIGVAVVPGSSFYSGDQLGSGLRSQRVRFNFAKRASTLNEAARRLEALRPKGQESI